MDPKQMDLDVLDELVGKCEDKMVSPFKKKAPIALELEVDSADKEEVPEVSEESSGPADLEHMDLQDLISMYQDLKENQE